MYDPQIVPLNVKWQFCHLKQAPGLAFQLICDPETFKSLFAARAVSWKLFHQDSSFRKSDFSQRGSIGYYYWTAVPFALLFKVKQNLKSHVAITKDVVMVS